MIDPLRTDSGHLRDTPRAYVIPPIDRHMFIVCPLFVQAGEGHIVDSYNEGTGQTQCVSGTCLQSLYCLSGHCGGRSGADTRDIS